MHFLFLLILSRLIPGATILYIIFWEALQSPDAFNPVISSLVLDDEIHNLKEVIPDYGKFLCLHFSPCVLDGLCKTIVLFDIAAV